MKYLKFFFSYFFIYLHSSILMSAQLLDSHDAFQIKRQKVMERDAFIVKNKEVMEKVVKSSFAQKLIEKANRETPYEEAPMSSFLAQVGEELNIEKFNAILANPKDPRYSDAFSKLEIWLMENGFENE